MSEIIRKRIELFSRILDEFPEMRYLGDSILRTPTQKVGIPEGKQIAEKLGEVLTRYRGIVGFGRGLAAPQIGIDKSVFVTYVNDEIQTYINPKIINQSKENNFYRELCLSSGIMWCDVKRPSSIILEWTDKNGKLHTQEFNDVMARLLQHEEAHLRGKPNLDEAVSGTIEIMTADPLKEQLRTDMEG